MLTALLLVITSVISPIDHDDYECMDHDYCGEYEDDSDGETYCFFGCDNIIVIPGLPGMDK